MSLSRVQNLLIQPLGGAADTEFRAIFSSRERAALQGRGLTV